MHAAAFGIQDLLDRCPASPHVRHLGVCHCECVFVDVGLNDGSTLLHWPRNAARSTAMSAGTIRRDRRIPGLRWHLREQPLLRARMKRCLANSTANSCFYGFEANGAFTARLLALQRRLRVAGQRVALFTETALATFDGQLRFVRDETKLHLGSSIEACGSAVTAPAPGKARSSVAVVQAVDAARFLSSLAGAHSGLVAAKMGAPARPRPRATMPAVHAPSCLAPAWARARARAGLGAES